MALGDVGVLLPVSLQKRPGKDDWKIKFGALLSATTSHTNLMTKEYDNDLRQIGSSGKF